MAFKSPYQGMVQKKPDAASAIRSQEVSSIRIGPIPSPQDMALYNQQIPNGADRIMRMAETQSTHRIGIENKVITAQQKQGSRGQLLGFAIGIVGILAGSYVALHGHDTVGGIIAGTTVVSLVYAFVFGQRSQKQNLASKAE